MPPKASVNKDKFKIDERKNVVFNPFPKQIEFLEAVLSSKYSFILYGGAIRGGKTYALLGLHLILAKAFPGSRYAIIRENIPQLKINVLPIFNQIFPDYFIEQYPAQHNSWIARFTNGSELIFFSEDYDSNLKYLERFRGLEIDGASVEEMSGIARETFDKLLERLGTWKMRERLVAKQKGQRIPPQFVAGTCNPTWRWLKQDIYEPWKKGTLQKEFKYIPAKVTDNPYIDQDWVDSKKATLAPLLFKMFIEGDWDVNLNENAWLFAFNRAIHIAQKPLTINPYEQVILSFDFNHSPASCLVMQNIVGLGLFVYDEHFMDGGTEALCEVVEPLYRDYLLKITGDSSGWSKSSLSGMYENDRDVNVDYNIIWKAFSTEPDTSTRGVNPRLAYSRSLINHIFRNYPVFIDPRCTKLIEELETAQPDKMHRIIKNVGANGGYHIMDCLRYGIHMEIESAADLNYLIATIKDEGFIPPPEASEEAIQQLRYIFEKVKDFGELPDLSTAA